jgi:1,4-alpha-glucan branching enzyme
MGQEFAQGAEWNHNQSLDWHQLDHPLHAGMQALVRDLNRLYRATPALHINDTRPEGFQWLESNDAEGSTYAWLRRGRVSDPTVAIALNMTPVERRLRIGLPAPGQWDEVLNTDAAIYGGGNRGNLGGVTAEATPWQGQRYSALVTLPPLSAVYLQQAAGPVSSEEGAT